MYGRARGLTHWVGAGLLLGSIGCAAGDTEGDADPGKPGEPEIPTGAVLASLARASDCGDLLTRIQDDAIAKLKMSVARTKAQAVMILEQGEAGPTPVSGGVADAGSAVPRAATDDLAGNPGTEAGGDNGASSGAPTATAGDGEESGKAPIGSSDTNRQVADVDEADFVKVVENGRGIFLLHGNTLQKLKSWPAAETALTGTPLKIEGSPSEMFVSERGKAVVFSSVYGYGSGYGAKEPYYGAGVAVDCAPGYCGYSGGTALKVTVADVSGAEPVVERELYYEGWYVSSRRYGAAAGDVVRAVVQSNSRYAGLFQPEIDWYDAWGRPYDEANIATQLEEWEQRTIASIRKTALEDWLPGAHEQRDGELQELPRQCGDYFVPSAGLSDYGLTQVLSLDLSGPDTPVGGVTIVGASSTVYSSAERLVLAQPDYRWSAGIDFGVASEQHTALHLFTLEGANTSYLASGWVFGGLPSNNPQFGLDVAVDGTLRVATTGWARDDPALAPEQPEFWRQHTENYVSTLRAEGAQLALVGRSEKLGKENESMFSARFVGARAYVVTARRTDPLIVLDLSNAAAPAVLGQIEIPGISEYLHPLDETHLITSGQSGDRGAQLQLFDVANPASIPAPKVFDFGSGSSTAVSYDHKAFTFYEGMIAMPVSGYQFADRHTYYTSALQIVRVDANAGFSLLGTVDHAPLYADNGLGVQCGYCDAVGCYDYVCGGYAPEVRRGHFVQGEGATYVYSFSHAGVLVNDLQNLSQPVARVGLPAPSYDSYGPWYGGGRVDAGVDDPAAPRDAGASLPPSMGSASAADGGTAMPTSP